MATKVKKCIVCDGITFKPYGGALIKCQNCGLVVAREIPTPVEIQKLYQQEYFFGKEYSDYLADRSALEHNFRLRAKRLSFMLKPDFNVVELGCAYGYFLYVVKDKVKSHIGFDVAKDGVAFAKKELGINATTDEFLDHIFVPKSVDSLFMWDVIEHLSHPDAYFNRISEVLRPGGYLALTTGNIDAWVPRHRGASWRMIHPPTHLYYFGPKTIRLLCRKYGLEVVSVKHKGISRNVGSIFNQIIANRKALHKATAHLVVALTIAKIIRLDKLNPPINTFDVMEVVVRKV